MHWFRNQVARNARLIRPRGLSYAGPARTTVVSTDRRALDASLAEAGSARQTRRSTASSQRPHAPALRACSRNKQTGRRQRAKNQNQLILTKAARWHRRSDWQRSGGATWERERERRPCFKMRGRGANQRGAEAGPRPSRGAALASRLASRGRCETDSRAASAP